MEEKLKSLMNNSIAYEHSLNQQLIRCIPSVNIMYLHVYSWQQLVTPYAHGFIVESSNESFMKDLCCSIAVPVLLI